MEFLGPRALTFRNPLRRHHAPVHSVVPLPAPWQPEQPFARCRYRPLCCSREFFPGSGWRYLVKIWKVILATLVIFGAGVITGGLLVNHVVKIKKTANKPAPPLQALTPWQQRSRDLLHRMERELDLTPEQRQHVEKIIMESQERTRSLWKPIAPQMNREMVRVREEMREELTPEQRKRFDELLKPRQKKQDEKSLASTNAAQSNFSSTPQ